MSRLIVVSNRVNPPEKRGDAPAGGLAVAIAAALREYSGFWFGWSGQTTEGFTGEVKTSRVDDVTVRTIDLEEGDYQEYYNGYANGTLWPLFHYRIDLTAYDRSFGEGYDRVNRRFAEALAPLIEPGDLIWVHDYHLFPLARELRRLGIGNPIGFFLHIPWPAPQLLTTLPRHRALVEAMFDYDLVGFQTDEWLWAFESYVLGEAAGTWTRDGRMTAFGKTLSAKVFPIGLDVETFTELAASDTAIQTYDRMAAHAAFRSMVVGVERLDYSKGLEERLLGFERFLADNPYQRGKVLYLQVAPTSRGEVEAYQDMRGRLDALTGRINSMYGDMDFSPVRFINRNYRRDELAGVYRAAKVGLVTPLRDGMNLVAKEYVAAQDPHDPGVLVLSRFAGAARQMTEAVIVNPFSHEEMAEALKRALTMERAERIDRWQALMEGVRRTDVKTWRDAFVRALSATRGTGPVSELPVAQGGWRGVRAFDFARGQLRGHRRRPEAGEPGA
ncbi:alpha,alpha-trehalose-phosphate synthase (UDP-forming) [Caulobacter sp. KR2-114]|uniref:alpha,alpha-trehalose-phosphate synthase (UDP-forming) n=1 Tax=Caulobacter sp. KR2-114 TaxID=3400912 RepID=UPI003C06D8FE